MVISYEPLAIMSAASNHNDAKIIRRLKNTLRITESVDPIHYLYNVCGRTHGGLTATQVCAILWWKKLPSAAHVQYPDGGMRVTVLCTGYFE